MQQNEASLPKAIRGFSDINRYWDKYIKLPAAKILPGQYYVTTHDEAIITVLGSCISACIRDRVYQIGGMNHFMLPKQNANMRENNILADANRYGNYAMENMINEILKNGGRRQNLEVKIFGGGKILASMTDIGLRNINFVHDYIREECLDLVAEDIGDIYPRKVVYFPHSGKAKVKRLRSLHNNTVIEREISYMHDIEEKPIEGGIELF